ncbi:unnamed protein product [Lactuca saligna]|uniref:Uncharacterized protein n=1 Tax=Lactuca saligna TaxID=75948 RepID=A0AA35VW96_LACSI|nr:unnamed protein product [Lactuca saligna]
MMGAGSWRTVSLPVEEQPVSGTTDPTNTPTVLTTSDEEPMEDSDEIEADDIFDLSEPDYTPAKHENIISDYELEEGEDDTTTFLEISPSLPTPSHISYRSCATSTRVKNTMMKTTSIPSRKRPASPSPTKKHCSNYTWMPQIKS